jgi:hypothetical protein
LTRDREQQEQRGEDRRWGHTSNTAK